MIQTCSLRWVSMDVHDLKDQTFLRAGTVMRERQYQLIIALFAPLALLSGLW